MMNVISRHVIRNIILNHHNIYSNRAQIHASKFIKFNRKKVMRNSKYFCVAIGLGAVLYYIDYTYKPRQYYITKYDANRELYIRLTTREMRFLEFASVEYNNQIYMTPQDFLESVVQITPVPRLKLRKVSEDDVARMQKITSSEICAPKLFRTLRNNGLISYTEYMFLLSILTKPIHSLKICFDMFDRNMNGLIDRDEYMLIEEVFGQVWKDRRRVKNTGECSKYEKKPKHYLDCNNKNFVNTTLSLHLFGPKGDINVAYKDFENFVLCIQNEVLEYEFNLYSQGLNFISEDDFAKILLKYTYSTDDEFSEYFKDYLTDLPQTEGIRLEDFIKFCKFLNHMEDLQITMKFFNLAGFSINKEQFIKAIKICIKTEISDHLINTVYTIFDQNDDDIFSSQEYKHFVKVMKDRLYRGFRSYVKDFGWIGFKQCVKEETVSFGFI